MPKGGDIMENTKERIKEIMEKIEQIVGRDQEVTPDFYGEIFFDIASLTGVEEVDRKRYFKYAINEFERRISKT